MPSEKELRVALGKARDRIRADNNSPSGYLEAARILRLISSPELAMTMENKARAKLQLVQASPSKKNKPGQDHVSKLPTELFTAVMSLIPFRERVRCLQVCSAWKLHLSHQSVLWTKLDFTEARTEVKSSTVNQYLKYANGQLQEANLSKLAVQNNHLLQMITQRSKKLVALRILTGGFLGPSLEQAVTVATSLKTLCLGAHVEVTQPTYVKIVEGCHSLTFLQVQNFRGSCTNPTSYKCTNSGPLRTLKIGLYTGTHDYSVENFTPVMCISLERLEIYTPTGQPWLQEGMCLRNHYPNLKHLRLNNIRLFNNCQYLLPNSGAILLPQSLMTLHLSCRNCSFHTGFEHNVPADRVSRLPNIKELELSLKDESPRITLDRALEFLPWDPQIHRPLPHFTRMTSLKLSHIDIPIGFLEEFVTFKEVQNLVHFSIKGWTVNGEPVGDSEIYAIADSFPKLQTIDASITFISGSGIARLVDRQNRMRVITVEDCPKIDMEAVHWARRQGVTVTVTYPVLR